MYRTVIALCLFLFIFSCAKNKIIDSINSDFGFGTDETLDIITWNIEHFPKHGEITVDHILEIIDSMDVDIIGMQEIWGDEASSSFDTLINKLDGWSGHRKLSGLAYLYKTELVINDIYEINALNDIIRTPYLLSINWSGQDIYIINNHFKAFGGSINEQQRKIASKKIENYINNHLEDYNVIVIGDLNDDLADEENINVFQIFINDSTKYKFVDMEIAYGSSSNFSKPDYPYPSHLDHILITNELFDEFRNPLSKVETIHIEDYFDGGWNEYDNFVSDHRPVGLRLYFNP